MEEKWAWILCTINREYTSEHDVPGETAVYDLHGYELEVCISDQFWSYNFLFKTFVLFLYITEYDRVHCVSLMWINILFQDSESWRVDDQFYSL